MNNEAIKEKVIKEVMADSKISPSLAGYSYIRYMLEIALADNEPIILRNKLYPMIQEKFGVTYAMAVRNINSAMKSGVLNHSTIMPNDRDGYVGRMDAVAALMWHARDKYKEEVNNENISACNKA